MSERAAPKVHSRFRIPTLRELRDDDEMTCPPSEESVDAELQSISSFLCIIEYMKDHRQIVGCRFDMIGDLGYVGAICYSANGYRCFRTDRISTVFDAQTGEVLGDGSYFFRFAPSSVRERAPTWGLTPSRRATLAAGLNVLAFMARCDGSWHKLEVEPIERFVCSMWLRKEWDGEPPLAEILAHAQRLAPDAQQFRRGLEHYTRSDTSALILRRAVGDLIAADGIVHSAEFDWVHEVTEHLGRSW